MSMLAQESDHAETRGRGEILARLASLRASASPREMELIDAAGALADELAADMIDRKADAVSRLLGEGKVSAEVADHVARVARQFAHDLREGLHRD